MCDTALRVRPMSGKGPPVVLVHGSGTDGSRWAPVLPMLAARFTVYAVDRRGTEPALLGDASGSGTNFARPSPP